MPGDKFLFYPLDFLYLQVYDALTSSMNNNIYSNVIRRAIQLSGSEATTPLGIARAILKYPHYFKQAAKEPQKKISVVLDRLPIKSPITLHKDTDYGYRFKAQINGDA